MGRVIFYTTDRARLTQLCHFQIAIAREHCFDIQPQKRITVTFAYDKAALREIVLQYALKFGQFTLASGKQASYYLDCRTITLHPKGANHIAAGMLDVIASGAFGSMPDAVGGLAIGADPITASIVVHAGLRDLPLLGFMVRKEPKQHGTGKLVEGPVTPGMKVVIVEDVITSGGSALKAATAAREFGLDVIGAVGIIDRLEGGQANFDAAGIPLKTLFTIEDFLEKK